MMHAYAAFARRLIVAVAMGVLGLQGPVQGQVAENQKLADGTEPTLDTHTSDGAAAEETAATVFVGKVLGPDGAPVMGAVVVTTAGGQTLTDAQGAFSLGVELPANADSVRVTAILGSGAGTRICSAQVRGLALSGTTQAGTLVLDAADTCQPSWLPTFGQAVGLSNAVTGMGVFDDGSGPALYAGGGFTSALDSGDSFLAKWGGCSPPPSPWTDLGSGLAGISGIPQLSGTGDLVDGTPGSLTLNNAAPFTLTMLFASVANTPTPFKGGTLSTVPIAFQLPVGTFFTGSWTLPWSAWPSGVPSETLLYFQVGVSDAAAPKGVAISNLLKATQP